MFFTCCSCPKEGEVSRSVERDASSQRVLQWLRSHPVNARSKALRHCISVLLSRWLSSLCSYEWYYNGRRLDTSNLSSSTYYVHNASVDGSLHIKTWSASTQGYYHCHAVNTAGVTMSPVCFVQEAGTRLTTFSWSVCSRAAGLGRPLSSVDVSVCPSATLMLKYIGN